MLRLCLTILFLTVDPSRQLLLGDLPEEIVQDIISIFVDGTIHILGNCTGSNDNAPETQFWINTRDNRDDPIIVNATSTSPPPSPGQRKVIFLIHGWVASAESDGILDLKNNYLIRYDDAYVVSVNWEAYSMQTYLSSMCALPGIADAVALFICNLKSTYNVSLDDIHIVGHSLGGQMSGLIGERTPDICNEKIGRITGLDPAGPGYDGIDPKDRLDQSDAVFVDVLHTSVAQAGYLGSCGALDSYANCGYHQPGCNDITLTGNPLQLLGSLLSLPFDVVVCNHHRAFDYFAESILSDRFVARQCSSCGKPICLPNYFASERVVIGEDTLGPGEVQNYVFYTYSSPPYAKG